MDFAPAIAFYESALEIGANPAAKVGWNAGEGYQIANLVALCEVEGLVDGVSVLDVGCGLGALVDYFAAIDRRVDYVGVDISSKTIDAARARHPGAVFEVRDILTSPPQRRFDFVLCSGTLNYRIPDHDRWMTAMLARMYQLADRAAVVNMLNAAFPPSLRAQLLDQNPFVRMWPEDVVRYCRTLTPRIEINDAWGGTFEIILWHSRSSSIAQLARTLGITDGDSANASALIELATRRRLHAELRDFLRTLPETATTLTGIARAQARLQERTDAIAALERAAALAPTRADPCISAGRLFLEMGQHADAQTWFREAVARDPSSEDARYGLVISLVRSGDRDAAREIALAAPQGTLRDLLDALTAPDPMSASLAFNRTLAAAPRSLDAIAGVATFHEQAGRWNEAAALWERALAIAGDDPRLRDRLAQARTRLAGL